MGENVPGANQHFIIFKTEDNKIEVDVLFQDETVWLTLDQMSALFGRDKSTVSRHIKNVFEEGELERNAVVANFATVQTEGTRQVERALEYYHTAISV